MGLFGKKDERKGNKVMWVVPPKTEENVEEEKAIFPADYPKEQMEEVEKWRKWNEPAYPPALRQYLFDKARIREEHIFYQFDDIYRKFVDALKEKYAKKLNDSKQEDMKKIREVL